MSTPLQKKWAAKNIDADDIYFKDRNSITFIYDPRKDKLYAAPYDQTHPVVAAEWLSDDELGELKAIDDYGEPSRSAMLEKGYILGRMGHVPWSKVQGRMSFDEDAFVIPVISFWNHEFTDAQIKRTLQKLAGDYPNYFIANPDETIVTGENGEGVKTSFLSDWGVTFSGGQYQKKDDSPECQAIGKVDVEGKPLDLQDILGALHSTRGEQLGYVRGAFCSAYPQKKQAAQAADCELQSKMLDTISNRLQCGKNDWKKYLQTGRLARRQKLRDIFSKPEEITKQFRTQSEIDAAWAELMYGKRAYEHFSFKEWLNAQ